MSKKVAYDLIEKRYQPFIIFIWWLSTFHSTFQDRPSVQASGQEILQFVTFVVEFCYICGCLARMEVQCLLSCVSWLNKSWNVLWKRKREREREKKKKITITCAWTRWHKKSYDFLNMYYELAYASLIFNFATFSVNFWIQIVCTCLCWIITQLIYTFYTHIFSCLACVCRWLNFYLAVVSVVDIYSIYSHKTWCAEPIWVRYCGIEINLIKHYYYNATGKHYTEKLSRLN